MGLKVPQTGGGGLAGGTLSMTPLIIGHRGCKDIEPENTLLGIKKAVSLGVDGVEIDVHLSKDKELVVIHDETVDRTTNGKGYVKDLTLKEIKTLDARKGEKIPTLNEVVSLIQDKILLTIELKVPGTEKKVVDLIKKNKLKKVMVISFIHQLVKNVKKIDKTITTGVLFAAKPIDPADLAKKADANFVVPQYKPVDKEFVAQCHKKGIKVSVWNIDNIEELKKYANIGLDIIGSNRPDIIINYFKGK